MITWELKVPAEWPSDEAVYNETTYGFEEIMEAVETSVMLPSGLAGKYLSFYSIPLCTFQL